MSALRDQSRRRERRHIRTLSLPKAVSTDALVRLAFLLDTIAMILSLYVLIKDPSGPDEGEATRADLP